VARALAAVPRAGFIPGRVWPEPFGPPLDRDSDPDAWTALVTADSPVTTQVDERGLPTSSSSQPSVVARMLTAADVRPGHRVLEIGTATGWNAALLAHLTGREVVSVEIDPGLAADASHRLRGHRVRVVVRDGADPPSGPYDRVVATYAVVRIPPAWISGTKTGGRIVTPWKPGAGLPGGVLVALDVDGGRAEGRVLGEASFMLDRNTPRLGRPTDLGATPTVVRTVDGDPRDTVMDEQAGPVLALTVPAWRAGRRIGDDGEPYLWAEDAAGESWLRAHRDGRVESAGPRDLWAELTAARRAWVGAGSPPITDYGLTVDPGGRHRVWLGAPEHPGWTHP
jgi:protein-L-isoaspartate O-methyltransferase